LAAFRERKGNHGRWHLPARDDAVRIAFTELVGWIHTDYGLSDLDAYELLSKVGKIHLTEMVDPNYVVVASVEKSICPRKVKTFVEQAFLPVPSTFSELGARIIEVA